MLAPVTHHLSWTMASTPRCHTRKTLTPAPSPSWWTNYQRNSESWWLFANKISTMPRNFKNKLIIRESNLGAMPPLKKFGWTANISRSNVNKSWKQNSLGRSGCSILLGSKHTSWSFLKNGESIIFSMCYCWNRIPQRRDKCMRRMRRNWTPMTITGNTRWKQFGTARSMRESQNRVTYQASTTGCLRKGTQRKKIPGS